MEQAQERTFMSRQKRDWEVPPGGNANIEKLHIKTPLRTKYYTGATGVDDSAILQRKRQYEPAMKVRHKHFGEGTIISVKGNGDDMVLKVAFPDKGIKDLVAIYAPLEII